MPTGLAMVDELACCVRLFVFKAFGFRMSSVTYIVNAVELESVLPESYLWRVAVG